MSLHLRAAIVLLGSALVAPLAALPAAAQAAPSAEAEEITLTFRPPLGTPVRYRVAQSRERTGQAAVATVWVEQLRFEKAGDGYVLHWRIDPASLEGALRDPAVGALLAPFTGDPIAFDVDAEGEVLRVRDWEKVHPRLLALIDSAAKGWTQADAAALAQVRRLFEGMTQDQAPAILLKSILPAFGWGGLAMARGESITSSQEAVVPLFNVPIEREITIALAKATPGDPPARLRFEVRSAIGDAALRSLLTRVAEQMGVTLDSPKGREMQAELTQIAGSVADRTVAVFDAATALPRSVRNERRASAGTESQVQTLELTLLD